MTARDKVLTRERRRGLEDAMSFRAVAVSEGLDGTAIIDNEDYVPDWRAGPYDIVGAPVCYGEQVYKVWQAHDSTGNPGWDPEQAVSLFDILHTTDPEKAKPYVSPQGVRGAYAKGECCIWEGGVWRSVIDSNAWTPEGYPQGWEQVEV